jgi:cytosine/adenosine deaminase-related metal-dependent hydrolase
MTENRFPVWTLTARWVFPVSGLPLERGTVSIRSDRLVAVEPHGQRPPDHDLGNAALLPGLVNAHTHLDLTGLRGRVPPSADFTGWLRAVVRHRRSRSPEQVQADIRDGLAESLRYGTTLLGDIAAGGATWTVLANAPLRAVVFHEVLGLPKERAKRAWVDLLACLQQHTATPTCRPGISPHAAYSVHRSILRAAARTKLPMTIHLAETAAELELLEYHRGPFVPFLTELGVWEPSGLVNTLGELQRRTRSAGPVLFAHGNYLSPTSVIPANGSVVYCPRTHAAFGHPPHPFQQLLARGVRVALGTDSLASNPDLDVLAEARFLHHRYPAVPGSVVLRLATLSGAEALGWQDETGSLAPGKSADLVVLPLPSEDRPDPHALVLKSSLPVSRVLWRGQWRS